MWALDRTHDEPVPPRPRPEHGVAVRPSMECVPGDAAPVEQHQDGDTPQRYGGYPGEGRNQTVQETDCAV